MKREDVKIKHAEGIQFDTHLIANPANTQEWIAFFKRKQEEAFSWSMTTKKLNPSDTLMI